MKHRSILRLPAMLVLLLAAACSYGQKVSVDFDKTANFASFKTYAWTTGTPAVNPLMHKRIVDGIESRLAAKGLQKVDATANPDLIVLYIAAVGTQIEFNTMAMGGTFRWRGGSATTTMDKVPIGTLSVDLGDAKTRDLLWMARGSDTLSDNPEKVEKTINKVLDKMFKKYPPTAKK